MSFLSQREYDSDDRSGLRIDDQLVAITWILLITIRRLAADEEPLLGPLVLCVSEFLGDVPSVHVIENVLEGDNFITALVRIKVICNGNIADAFGLEEYLRIVAGHDVVTAQTG